MRELFLKILHPTVDMCYAFDSCLRRQNLRQSLIFCLKTFNKKCRPYCSASKALRKRSNPRRTRVFTVPNGQPSWTAMSSKRMPPK